MRKSTACVAFFCNSTRALHMLSSSSHAKGPYRMSKIYQMYLIKDMSDASYTSCVPQTPFNPLFVLFERSDVTRSDVSTSDLWLHLKVYSSRSQCHIARLLHTSIHKWMTCTISLQHASSTHLIFVSTHRHICSIHQYISG